MNIPIHQICTQLLVFIIFLFSSLPATFAQPPWLVWEHKVSEGHFLGATALLQDGRVMVIGGKNSNSSVSASVEIIDPISGTVTKAPNLTLARYNMRALLLRNGKVFVIGGQGENAQLFNQCELYDPISNSWITTGAMNTARARFTATLLNDGRVLVTGGSTGSPFNGCELFNPYSGLWSAAPDLPRGPSNNHAAVLLPDGRVLVTNGYSGLDPVCQLFNPVSNSWSLTGAMKTHGSGDHTLTLMPNGKVLLTGGWPPAFSRTEIYDPQTNQWTVANPLRYKRAVHNATLLPNGKLLISGGIDSQSSDNSEFSLATTELYSYQTGVWTTGPNLPIAMDGYASCILPDGRVLLAAGGKKISSQYERPNEFLNNILTWQDLNPTWSTTGSFSQSRTAHTLTLLPTGMVLAAGGTANCEQTDILSSSELYNFRTRTWTAAADMQQARAHHTTTLLADGTAIVVGGRGADTVLSTTEAYDAELNIWKTMSPLSVARSYHTATLLHDGNLLIVGGTNSSGNLQNQWKSLSSVERYISSQRIWQIFPPLNIERFGHTATLLPNGTVLVAGGRNSKNGYLASAERYENTCVLWQQVAPMKFPRAFHTATLLPNGNVLVTGGISDTGSVRTTEIYDYRTNTWIIAGTLPEGRHSHTATLLHNGGVLLTGGVSLSGTTETIPQSTLLYNLSSNSWQTTTSLPVGRIQSEALLLPDNTLLLTGGYTPLPCNTYKNSHTYDVGLGYNIVDRPVINTLTPTSLHSVTGSGYVTLTVTGTGFQDRNNRHGSEASSGNFFTSATNYPIIEIKRMGGDTYDNDFVRYLPFDVGNFEWSDTATQVRLNKKLLQDRDIPSGYYRLSVIANGIPSLPVFFAINDTNSSTKRIEVVSASIPDTTVALDHTHFTMPIYMTVNNGIAPDIIDSVTVTIQTHARVFEALSVSRGSMEKSSLTNEMQTLIITVPLNNITLSDQPVRIADILGYALLSATDTTIFAITSVIIHPPIECIWNNMSNGRLLVTGSCFGNDLQKITTSVNVRVTPEPSQGLSTVDIEAQAGVTHHLALYSPIGALLYQTVLIHPGSLGTLTSVHTDLLLKFLPNGIYFLVIDSDGYRTTRPLRILH